MKRILLLYLFLFLVLTLQAQQIAVKSFRSLSNDLDARTYYPKEDRNGEKAALIKIVTTETNFEFDAGSIGIVAQVPKTSEIWLYVPRGSKAVTIMHPKLGLLRNYAYPEPIEAGEVYEMVLTTGKVVTTIEEQSIESQWLIISTEPSGADVYINEQPAGQTPFQNELPIGKYTWRVSKELYLPEAGVAELLIGSEKQVMKLTLKPNFGSLNITSTPESGASLSLDGIGNGKVTPCTLEMIPAGDHTITLSREMFETTTQRITLRAGENKQVAITMKPTFAQVSVTSALDAYIYINGQLKTKAPWQGRLNPGVYTFEARLEKYKPAIEKRTVIVAQPLNIELNPMPKTGNLKIITLPIEANIKMDGKEMGITPLTLKNLLIGDYKVELSLPGYGTLIKEITIDEGQTVEINDKLSSVAKPSITTKSVTDINRTTATSGGHVTSDGGAKVLSQGVCWNTNSNPTILDRHTTDATGTSDFSSSLSGLLPSTTYHVRAYATNTEGTSYGEDVDFKTLEDGTKVQITSNPSGVDLYIDGKPVGKTPYNGFLKFGSHNIKIEDKKGKAEKYILLSQGGYTIFALDLEYYQKEKRNNSNFGFGGSTDTHEMLGGFHYRAGFSSINTTSFDFPPYSDNANGYIFDIYYNNSKALPITFDIGVQSNNNYLAGNFGAYLSCKFTKRFTFDFGGGYQAGSYYAFDSYYDQSFSNAYLKAGCTLMFDGENWGGVNYSYMRSLGGQYITPSHNISYIFGREPTKWITYLALILGLATLAL
jgi:hypothetical protein